MTIAHRQDKCKKLLPSLRQYCEKERRVALRVDKLYIDSQQHHHLVITSRTDTSDINLSLSVVKISIFSG